MNRQLYIFHFLKKYSVNHFNLISLLDKINQLNIF